MNLSGTQRRRAHGFDMTPMIDVVMQLIIFFLFTSQFSQVLRSPIDLPEETGDEVSASVPGGVIVDVTAEGVYLIEGESRTLENTVRLIVLEHDAAVAGGGRLDLLIRADRSGPAAHINRLANRLAAEGVRQWKLGTHVPGGGG